MANEANNATILADCFESEQVSTRNPAHTFRDKIETVGIATKSIRCKASRHDENLKSLLVLKLAASSTLICIYLDVLWVDILKFVCTLGPVTYFHSGRVACTTTNLPSM